MGKSLLVTQLLGYNCPHRKSWCG